jgi:hypothetical protein
LLTNPLLFCLSYLVGEIRQRTRAARDGDRELGALSLEWIVIATLAVIAAVAVGAYITTTLVPKWEGQVPTAPGP